MKRRQLTPFGVLVKTAVIEKGMTLAQLAALAGTSPDYLCLIMYGDRPRSKYIHAIERVLELPEVAQKEQPA